MNVYQIYNSLLKKHGPQNWWPIYIPLKKFQFLPPRAGSRFDGTISNFSAQGGSALGGQFLQKHSLTYGIPFSQLSRYRSNFRDPHFEIAIGAILAQNVTWANVAVAIKKLYELKALRPENILKLNNRKLEQILYSTRYYTQKTKKVKQFSQFLVNYYDGNILNLKKIRTANPWHQREEVRRRLLEQWGIGRETADSIMLYALNIPIFVIDVYTKRYCANNGIILKDYDDYRLYFEENLEKRFLAEELVKVYQEFHALLVVEGQNYKNSK